MTGPERYYTGIRSASATGYEPSFPEKTETRTIPGTKESTPEYWRDKIMKRSFTDYEGRTVNELNNWSLGMINGMKRFIDEVPSLWEIAELATYNSLDRMSDELHNFFKTGKFEWQSFVSEILDEVSKLLMKQSVARFFAWVSGDHNVTPTSNFSTKERSQTSPEHKETTGLLTGIWESTKSFGNELIRGFDFVLNGIKGLGSTILNSLKNPIELLSGIGSILDGLWSIVKFGFTQIVALLSQIVSGKMFDKLMGKEGSSGGSSTGESGEESSGFGNFFSKLWSGAKGIFGYIWSGIKGIFSTIGGFWDKLFGILGKIPIIGKAFSAIGSVFQWVKNIPIIGKAIGWIASLFLHKGLSPGKVTKGVPKLHDGLKEDEFQAVLQKGERVVSRGDVHYEQKLLEKNTDQIEKVEDGVEDVKGDVKEVKDAIMEASQKSYGINNQTYEAKGLPSWVGWAFMAFSAAFMKSINKVKGAPPTNKASEVYAHKGLSPGKVTMPRLHKGLMKDEFPAILQKGERVVAKKEVHYEQKLLESIEKMVKDSHKSNNGSSGLSVNVPVEINALEPKQQHLTGQLQAQIERVVLNTIREYAR
jgi:hypothetical protein